MSNTELREVVTRPTKMAGLRIEPGLIDLILNAVGAEENSPETSRLPSLPYNPSCQ